MDIDKAYKKDIADAIREKKGTTALIKDIDFASEIRSIQVGGGQNEITVGKNNIEYLELSPDGWVKSYVPINAGQLITLKQGTDVSESNIGKRDYIPKLLFQEWSCPLPITDGKIQIPDDFVGNLTIGAIYKVEEGKSIFVIDIAKVSSISAEQASTCLNFSANAAGTTYIDWGDGVIDNYTGTSSTSKIHTWDTYGVKIIKVWNSTPTRKCMFGTGDRINGNPLFYQLNTGASHTLLSAYLDNVETIASKSFGDCLSLKVITIPKGVTFVSIKSFQNSISMTSVIIPYGVAGITNDIFNGCYSLSSVVLPYDVTNIGSNAFSSCYSIHQIVIPSTVGRISSGAFSYCNALKYIYCKNVASIESSAFAYCFSLSSFDALDNVADIKVSVFENCKSSLRYILGGSTVKTLESTSSFNNINRSCRIFVPDDLWETYKTATNWVYYTDYIYKISEMSLYE